MGDRTLPASDYVPDLKQAPQEIQGVSGGVANPPITMSSEQKSALEECGEMMEGHGIVYVTDGLTMAPFTEGGSLGISLLGCVMTGVGWIKAQLAKDHPKPFVRIVRTDRRAVAPTVLKMAGL